MELLNHLNWRYATKKFDPVKKVERKHLQYLSEAVRLSASSYGLQPYKVMIIQNDEIRKLLKEASWNQAQITDASHLFVFCIHQDYPLQEIDNYFSLIQDVQNADSKSLNGYKNSLKTLFQQKTPEEKRQWAARQVYIALGSLLIACAELKIDACPMEGFEKDRYDEILGLREQGFRSVVIAAVGYRSTEDDASKRKKARKPREILFAEI
jgi:nitroreductase